MSIPSYRALRRGSFTCGLAAAAIQTVLVFLISAVKLRSGTDDTDIYFRYATRALRGDVPYRDYLVEYPPLALPLFLAPAAVFRDVADFKVAFAVEMLLCNAAAVLLVAFWVERREGLARVPSRLAWYTLFSLILSRLIVTRYDAAPMLLGFGAALWWSSGRGALGGLAAALGALTKVYPAAVAILASVRELKQARTRRAQGAVAFTLTSMLGVAIWLFLGGAPGVSASVRYHLERGFEYGSLYSGAQMLVARLLGAEILISRDHASFSSITPWSQPLLGWVLPLQVVTILVVCGVFARRGMRDGVRYSGAAVLAFIVTGKVFSPQYLIWLMPYIAVLEGPVARRSRWLFAAVCATTLLAPSGLRFLPRTSLWVILAYNVRNILIVWLWILLVFGPLAGRANDEEVTPGPFRRSRQDATAGGVGLPRDAGQRSCRGKPSRAIPT
jgi:hypothetical protein